MSKLTPSEFQEWKRYCKVKGGNLNRCKVNELIIFPNNSLPHEQEKFNIYWEHRQQGCNVLTECYLGDERCDVICLTHQERYEPETDMLRAVRFLGKPVNIIPCGWSFEDKKWKELKAKHGH